MKVSPINAPVKKARAPARGSCPSRGAEEDEDVDVDVEADESAFSFLPLFFFGDSFLGDSFFEGDVLRVWLRVRLGETFGFGSGAFLLLRGDEESSSFGAGCNSIHFRPSSAVLTIVFARFILD